MIALLFALGAERAKTEVEPVYPPAELISDIRGEDLPAVPGPVAFWPARVGPNLVQDTTLAYGLPPYAELNGIGGVSLDRNAFPRLMFQAPLWPTPDTWAFLMVSSPTTAVATGNTRGYFFSSTALPGVLEGTRLIVAQNANSDGTFAKGGWFTDELEMETTPFGVVLGRGWHQFYSDGGIAGAASAGPQVDFLQLGPEPFWLRNNVLMGRGLFGQYRARAPSQKCVMFSVHSADLSSTATYLDASYFGRFAMWRGQFNITTARAIVQRAAAEAQIAI